MSNDYSRFLEIERLLEAERQELEEAEKIAEEILPHLRSLTRKEILNPVVLKVKLAKLDKKYRDIVYALFQLAVRSGPEGSFVILSPKKVLSIINSI